MSKINSVIEILNYSTSMDDVVKVWNEYCEKSNEDERIYPNDEYNLNELFSSVGEFARSASYGDFHFSQKYMTFNGYGNIVTFNTINNDNCPIDVNALVNYLIENGDTYNIIDSDELENSFLDEYFPNAEDFDKAEEIADKLNEDEEINYLTDEWDKIAEAIKAHWEE